MSTDRATAIRPQLKSPKPIFWERSAGATDYPSAVARMEADAAAIADGTGHERVWLVEHPPIYTAGTSARSEDLVIADRFPVYCTGRGGQFTYHGPGQRVAYVMLDLKQRGSDVRSFVAALEAWLIGTLASFGVVGERRTDRIGVWVRDPRLRTQEAKIAAIGIRVRRWVSFHGVSLNVDPDLSHFAGIVPCGVREYGVTSLAQLGIRASLDEVDLALHTSFDAIFGPTLAG